MSKKSPTHIKKSLQARKPHADSVANSFVHSSKGMKKDIMEAPHVCDGGPKDMAIIREPVVNEQALEAMSDRGKSAMMPHQLAAISRIGSLLEAKKNVYFKGIKVDSEEDSKTQLAAAKILTDFTVSKPEQKANINVNIFEKLIKTVDEDEIVDGDFTVIE